MTFVDTNQLKVKEPRAGWKGRFFHSQNMTFAYYAVAAGAWIHEHSHPNDEVWNVIDGELEIKIAAETQVAGPGCAVVVPPDTTHSVKALTDVRAIVVDYPRRNSIGGTELKIMDAAPAHFAPAPSAVVTAFTDSVISFDHLIRAHDLRQDNPSLPRGDTG